MACEPQSDYRAGRTSGHDWLGNALLGDQVLYGKFLIWIDGVGGFLVLLPDTLVIGQAVPESHVDIPLLADIRRRHLRISRNAGDYCLEPFADLRINHQPVFATSPLKHRDMITIGRDVAIQFSQPHIWSGSARLDILSKHRTQPYCDAIVLLSESCVLGARVNSHVVCPGWSHDVLLFRDGQQLKCRSLQSFEVNGQFCDGRAVLPPNCRVQGDDFSLSLERTNE